MGVTAGPSSGPAATSKAAAALGSGRGKVRTAVRAAVKEAREAGRMTLEHEVRAVLAERYAELADRASAVGDGPALTKVGGQLLEVLDTLPVRTPGGGAGGDSSGDRGGLSLVLDGGPEVGDAAHS